MITAAAIRQAVQQRDRSLELARLDALAATERDALLAALDGLPDDAEVNVTRLIESARRRVADAPSIPDPARAFRYWCRIIATRDQLVTARRALAEGRSPAEAMACAQRLSAPPPRREARTSDQPRRRIRRRRNAGPS